MNVEFSQVLFLHQLISSYGFSFLNCLHGSFCFQVSISIISFFLLGVTGKMKQVRHLGALQLSRETVPCSLKKRVNLLSDGPIQVTVSLTGLFPINLFGTARKAS